MVEVDKELDQEVGREVEAREGMYVVDNLPLLTSDVSKPILQKTLRLN